MSARSEITDLEERLRQAELGADPAFFEAALADNGVLRKRQGIRHAQVHARLAETCRALADYRGVDLGVRCQTCRRGETPR